jgi:hypothetical protein
VSAVLLMENYDIERSGYHDTRDTMTNIDLDYGAALAAIAIEAVARATPGSDPAARKLLHWIRFGDPGLASRGEPRA